MGKMILHDYLQGGQRLGNFNFDMDAWLLTVHFPTYQMFLAKNIVVGHQQI